MDVMSEDLMPCFGNHNDEWSRTLNPLSGHIELLKVGRMCAQHVVLAMTSGECRNFQ